jgi:prophage regulatory protein
MQTTTQPKKFIRIAMVVERTGMAKPTIYQMIREGRFPASIKHGPRLAFWLEHEVEAWMDERILASRGQ